MRARGTDLADLDGRGSTRESRQTGLEGRHLAERTSSTGVDARHAELVGGAWQQLLSLQNALIWH